MWTTIKASLIIWYNFWIIKLVIIINQLIATITKYNQTILLFFNNLIKISMLILILPIISQVIKNTYSMKAIQIISNLHALITNSDYLIILIFIYILNIIYNII